MQMPDFYAPPLNLIIKTYSNTFQIFFLINVTEFHCLIFIHIVLSFLCNSFRVFHFMDLCSLISLLLMDTLVSVYMYMFLVLFCVFLQTVLNEYLWSNKNHFELYRVNF